MFNFLSLNILIFAPVIAALIIASPMFGTNQIYIRRFSKTFATLHFLYSLLFVLFYNQGTGTFYDEITVSGAGWLSKLGVNAAFGADGFTILLCVLTSFIFLMSLIVSKTMIRTKHKMYYTLMMLLLSTTLGIFCAKDMFVFLIFWEAELIPMYFLIGEWGSGKCKDSAMKYVLHTFFGSIFILLAMVGLYYFGYHANGVLSSSIDFLRIYQTDGNFPILLQKIIFWSFFIGFAIKLPIIPLHNWLPQTHSDAPTPISMFMAAITLNTGAYGLVRFNLDLFPELFSQYAPYIMIFSAINVIWAALAAFKQKDIKKIAAYAGISHMGLFLLGLSSLTKAGFDGAILVMFAHAFSAAGLFLVTGLIHQTTKTRSLQEITGLGKSMPRLMTAAYLIFFAAIGIPLTIGFPAELLVFVGSFSADFSNAILPKICSIIAILTVVLSASYAFKLFHGVFCQTDNTQKKYHDITGHRLMVVCTLCFCIILFGCAPDFLMSIYNDVTDMLIEILRM